MINKLMDEIKSKYTCTPVDADVFAKVVIDGANFIINAYDVEGVGRVATVQMKRLIGFWEMQSLIITPFEKDMPIYYVNRHREKGNYIFRVEVFNTQLDPLELDSMASVLEKYANLPEEVQNERWYDYLKLQGAVKKVPKNQKESVTPMIMEHFNVYLQLLENAPECKKEQKKKKATVFVNELCKQSGIAIVEIFIANYGEKIATKLCNEVLFGLK